MKCLPNKYYATYLRLVSVPDTEGYVEKHHVTPRSLGGDNSEGNLVRLSARKHFLAHWLLTKFTEGHDRQKMLQALSMMRPGRVWSSWRYAKAAEAAALAMLGELNPAKKEEVRKKLRDAKQSVEEQDRLRNHSWTQSDEGRAVLSNRTKSAIASGRLDMAALQEATRTPAARAKKSAVYKALWADPVVRARRMAAAARPETGAKRSAAFALRRARKAALAQEQNCTA